MTMPKMLAVTRVVSPFQIELGEAFRAAGIDYRILFSNASIGSRPKHWAQKNYPDWVYLDDIEHKPHRLIPRFMDFRPNVLLYGGCRGWPVPVAIQLCKRYHTPLAFWLEAPCPTTQAKNALRELIYRQSLQHADYVCCIGGTSLTHFQQILPERVRLACVPYGQDLSNNFRFERTYDKSEPIRFLFSGKFAQTNNTWELIYTLKALHRKHGDAIRFVFSAYAGYEVEVRKFLAQDPELRAITEFDTEFETWDDRLRPFRNAHVLLMPTLYAGWGLVVPEAMSLAMPVIGGPGLESAHFLVRDGLDGRLIEPTYQAIIDAVDFFVARKEELPAFGARARERARMVDAPAVVQRFIDVLSPHLGMGAVLQPQSQPTSSDSRTSEQVQ